MICGRPSVQLSNVSSVDSKLGHRTKPDCARYASFAWAFWRSVTFDFWPFNQHIGYCRPGEIPHRYVSTFFCFLFSSPQAADRQTSR